MKKYLLSSLFLLLISTGSSQTVVAWYAKVNISDLDDYNAHMEKYWLPVADKHVENGNLIGYQYLNHGWGDEWSVIIHFEAKNREAFSKAWSGIFKDYTESTPENVRKKAWKTVTDHKDNIYILRHSKRN